ncbi:MAG TPA: hypothetical protein VEW66_08585 [Thermomicrobiales bacterium]|nr:hypothetical protein [Thermomicrobiales bacterium]
MTPSSLRKASRLEEMQPWGGQRLRRVLGVRRHATDPLSAIYDLPPTGDELCSPFPTIAYLDATLATPTRHSPGDIALHVLWTAPGSRPILTLGDPRAEPIEYPCAPGDFLLVPANRSFAIGAGIVAVMIGTDAVVDGPGEKPSTGSLLGPTHGLPVFSRFNRQTFGVATQKMAVCRWKLTQAQTIDAAPDRPLWLSNLVEPVAVSWAGGMVLLDRTEGCFVAPGTSVTVSPNDLGYVLLAWAPNLDADVIAPLRSAGYTNADIATLGVPTFNPPT